MGLSTNAVATYAIHKGASVAALTVTRTGDGRYQFLDLAGNKITLSDAPKLHRLFDAINALV